MICGVTAGCEWLGLGFLDARAIRHCGLAAARAGQERSTASCDWARSETTAQRSRVTIAPTREQHGVPACVVSWTESSIETDAVGESLDVLNSNHGPPRFCRSLSLSCKSRREQMRDHVTTTWRPQRCRTARREALHLCNWARGPPSGRRRRGARPCGRRWAGAARSHGPVAGGQIGCSEATADSNVP